MVSGGAALVFGSLVAGTGFFSPALAAILGICQIYSIIQKLFAIIQLAKI